jgi:E3 ubiquitin-protein ligase RAD18
MGLSLLGEVGLLVRCPICRELLDAPVVLKCCHMFCSLCIRTALVSKCECPVCRDGKETNVVASVPVLDQVIGVLRKIPNVDDVLVEIVKRSSLKRARMGDDEDMGFSSQRATCFDCKLQVRDLKTHLPQCLAKGESERERFAQEHKDMKVPEKRRLAKLSYDTMSLKDLKNICERLLIGGKGSKKQLEWRHCKYVALFNANQDRSDPVSDERLRQLLTKAEAIQFAAKPAKIIKMEANWEKLMEQAKRTKVETMPVQDEVVNCIEEDEYMEEERKEERKESVTAKEMSGLRVENERFDLVEEAERFAEHVGEAAGRWVKEYSSTAGRFFFVDTVTLQGSFVAPGSE